MSLFDFLMPEVAQASHLRKIADSATLNNTQSRLQSARMAQAEQSASNRIKELESEVGQLTIVVEALLECLENANSLSKDDLAKKIGEIDARDGIIDERMTKKQIDPSMQQPKARKLNIPKA